MRVITEKQPLSVRILIVIAGKNEDSKSVAGEKLSNLRPEMFGVNASVEQISADDTQIHGLRFPDLKERGERTPSFVTHAHEMQICGMQYLHVDIIVRNAAKSCIC
jgi:hypothetical protein